MTLEERFRYIMKLNNLTASAFADEIGVQRSSVSHILSGRNKPSLEFIQKVLKRYPKIDAAWLINGTTQVESKVRPAAGIEDDHPTKLTEVSREADKDSVNQTREEGRLIKEEGKRIKRILIFYDDQSFEEFTSAASPAN